MKRERSNILSISGRGYKPDKVRAIFEREKKKRAPREVRLELKPDLAQIYEVIPPHNCLDHIDIVFFDGTALKLAKALFSRYRGLIERLRRFFPDVKSPYGFYCDFCGGRIRKSEIPKALQFWREG